MYPIVARLRMAPIDQQHCPMIGVERDCALLDAVQSAFGRVVSRLFIPGSSPDIELEVQVHSAEVLRPGLRFDLTTRVRVLTPGGEVIDEIDAGGQAPLLSSEDKDSLANAIRNAADDAAATFQRAYVNDQKVGEYLVSKKIGPPAVVALPDRSDRLVMLEAGLGFVQGSGESDFAANLSLRAALAWRWLLVQGMYSRYTSSFQGVQDPSAALAESDLVTNDLGLDVGAIYRFTRSIELRGGPGVHFLFGDASQGSVSQSFSKVAPGLFASISTSFLLSRNAPRFVLGMEFRAYFFSSVDVPQLLRTIPAANTAFALVLGVELPWDPKRKDTP